MQTRTRGVPILVATLLASLGPLARRSEAYLSIIRQGPESAGGLESNDRTGSALAVGDFNGDAREDLAMGAPYESANGHDLVGAVVVSFGSEHGITHENASWIIPSGVGQADQSDIRFGFSLASGDFDKDGLDDLAVGAPYDGTDGPALTGGRVYVLYADTPGASEIHSLGEFSGATIPGDRFGHALCAADFDSDGYDDLAIGAVGDNGLRGSVSVIYGSDGGLNPFDTQFFDQSDLGWTESPGDEFGFALAAGNVFQSDHRDLVISAREKTIGSHAGAGAVYVVAGSASGLNTGLALRYDASEMPGGGAETGARFGQSLAVGRLWPGGYESVAIGEPYRTVQGSSQAGRVVALPGAVLGLVVAQAEEIDQSDGFGTIESADRFGSSLSAGDYDGDTHEDLAVGSPAEDVGSVDAAGFVQIFLGGANGPHGSDDPDLPTKFIQENIGERSEVLDELGDAVAFGRFDASGRENLAIGAPGSGGGTVFIVAPWRQVLDLSCQTSIALNCDDEIIFAQKPFDSVLLASTTKIMTGLLACERMDPQHPDYVAPATDYEVPWWIPQYIEGSQYGLSTGDVMSFDDLTKVLMWVSGNDAAYSIAELLTPGIQTWGGSYENTVTEFVDLMNQRAGELGMSNQTVFSTPAGRPVPDPGPMGSLSTAADMAILARAALANPRLRTIMGTESEFVFLNDLPDLVKNWFLDSLNNRVASANGLKPGSNDPAQRTGVYSARKPGEDDAEVVAASFNTTKQELITIGEGGEILKYGGSTRYYDDAGKLLDLALSECPEGGEPGDWIQNDPSGGAILTVLHIPTGPDDRLSASTGSSGDLPDTTQVHLQRHPGSLSLVPVDLALWRHSEVILGPGETAAFGVAPFESHDGFHLINDGNDPADLWLTASNLTGLEVTLAPHESFFLDVYAGTGETSYWLSVQNFSALETVTIGVTERGYRYSPSLGDGTTAPDFFACSLYRDGYVTADDFRATIDGQAPAGGDEIYLVVHSPDYEFPTGVGRLPAPVVARLLAPFPNPFRSSTRIGFDLPARSEVRVRVFDVRGRQVRQLAHGSFPPGPHDVRWDGTDARGARLASGVYFYRLEVDGRGAGANKLLLLR